MSNLRAYILCSFAEQSSVYAPWLDRLPLDYEIVEDYLPDWHVPADAGILISHLHYRWEDISALRAATENDRVPVLILADGILEYRNTWEHPGLPNGALFQPLCGHKLACIGRGQARVIESWGNPGKCEIVGLPRLDNMLAKPIVPVNTEGPFRLLIATAKTPAFDDQQRQSVIDSLRCLHQRFERNAEVNGRKIQVTWRLTDGLEAELNLPAVSLEDQPPLAEAIDQSDAVITTPSTLYLESIARRRPTAVLDFWNAPNYVPTAWSISAASHIDRVISELSQPPAHKMLFQDVTLHDQLECDSEVTPRLLRVIDTMVAAGIKARSEHQPIALPPRILPDLNRGLSRVPESFDLAKLYPDNQSFETLDRQRLQVELAMAVQRLDQLPLELAEKNRYLAHLQTTLAETLERQAKLLQRFDEMNYRMQELRQHHGLKTTPIDNGKNG